MDKRFSEIVSLADARRFLWKCQAAARRLAESHGRTAGFRLSYWAEGREAMIVTFF